MRNGNLDECEAALRDGGYGAAYLIGYIAAHVDIHDTLMERFGDIWSAYAVGVTAIETAGQEWVA